MWPKKPEKPNVKDPALGPGSLSYLPPLPQGPLLGSPSWAGGVATVGIVGSGGWQVGSVASVANPWLSEPLLPGGKLVRWLTEEFKEEPDYSLTDSDGTLKIRLEFPEQKITAVFDPFKFFDYGSNDRQRFEELARRIRKGLAEQEAK